MGQIEDLHLYTLVVENRSISGAAEQLNIAKSAVSRRLNLLEERYGARLIDREPGKWEVTATGLELYQRALGVVQDARDIEGDFTEKNQSLAGPLTISVPRDFGTGVLSAPLIAFKSRHPEILLRVDFDDHVIDLSRDNYDFAIRITAQPGDSVAARRLGTTRHHICASSAHLAEYGTPKNLADLMAHPLLHYGSTRRAQWEFPASGSKTESITFQPALNSNSGLFLLEACLAGSGIARLPDFICGSALKTGDLVPVLPDLAMPKWGIFLIHAENRRLNRRMRLFAEEMEKVCAPFLNGLN